MDYEKVMEIIKNYKERACELVKNNCYKCEAMQEEYRGRLRCSFDIVNKFINWDHKYNK